MRNRFEVLPGGKLKRVRNRRDNCYDRDHDNDTAGRFDDESPRNQRHRERQKLRQLVHSRSFADSEAI